MRTLWKTAYAAARLATQSGSDDGYYPSVDYKFSHGTRYENREINRALKLLDGKDDPMRHRAPGLILTKMRNRQRQTGPLTLHQINCRASSTMLIDTGLAAQLYGTAESGERKFSGLVATSDASEYDPVTIREVGSYAKLIAKAREQHEQLIASAGAGSQFVWITQGDSATRQTHAPALEESPQFVKDFNDLSHSEQQLLLTGKKPEPRN